MRVLVSAYACEPYKGSEPGLGWNWVLQTARFHDVWVITRANNRLPIEKALVSHPLPNVHWVYCDLPLWARFWKRGQRGVHLYYYLWQMGAYFAARKLHKQVGFDLVHHVTLCTYWMPSFLALLPTTFIWGPVGGGESAPPSFRRCFGLRGKVFELFRDLARRLGECDPFVRMTARRAAMALATTDQTAGRLRTLRCHNVSVLSQVALSQDEIRRLGTFLLRKTGPFRLISIGNLLHLKGIDTGLRAFALLHRRFPESEYWVVGDGRERSRLEALVAHLRLANAVTFWGAVPRAQALEKLAECDVLLHPSLHDSGGWVCAEAMAAGRPVICLDLGGPALQVTEETGIKVPAVLPDQVVRGLANAFYKLASDPELRARLSLGAKSRVEQHFNWDNKGIFMENVRKTLSVSIRSRSKAGLRDVSA